MFNILKRQILNHYRLNKEERDLIESTRKNAYMQESIRLVEILGRQDAQEELGFVKR